MSNMLPSDKWDYDAKPLLPGTRLHVEWVTDSPESRTFLLKVTHVGDDTRKTLLMTRQDARGLLKYLRRSGMVGQEMSEVNPQVYSGSGLEDCKNCGAYPDCHDGFGRCPRGVFLSAAYGRPRTNE